MSNLLILALILNHELSNESSESLKVLVEFVVGVYSPMWFDIKVKHQLINGPYHVLKQIKLVNQQQEKGKTPCASLYKINSMERSFRACFANIALQRIGR